jgi:hypothetical protein
MSEVQETGTRRQSKPNRFRITSITIAVAIIALMVVSSLGIMISTSRPASANPGPWEDFLAEMSFTREPRNPLMYATETWEGVEIGDYSVFDDVTNFVMFYTGFRYDAVANGIGRATAPPEYPMTNWTKYGKVFEGNATPGQWDSGSVRLGSVVKDNGTFYMYYGATPAIGFAGGPVKIGLATSTDELTWTRHGNASPVLIPSGDEVNVEDPAVLRSDSTHWYMYYSYRTAVSILPGIRVATSPNGVDWTKIGDVLNIGAPGQWDDTYLEHSQIYMVASHYVLLFEAYGGSGSEPWQTGIAYSTNPTSGFVKYSGNPIFSPSQKDGAFDQYHVDTPFLFNHDSDWYLFFGGADNYVYSPANWRMGIAYSPGTAPMTPPPQVKLWSAGGASSVSVAGSWTPAGVPRNGDTVIFNSTSSQNCAWDVPYLWLDSISMNTGYLGTVTMSVNIYVEDFLLANGTLQGSLSEEVKVSHNFVRTVGGTVPTQTFIITMLGNNGLLDGGPGFGILFRPYAIIFHENVTVAGDWVRAAGWFQLLPGKILTVASGAHLVVDSWVDARCLYNDGVIQGPGVFTIQAFLNHAMPTYFGTITAPVEMTLEPASSYNPTVTLASNLHFGGAFSIVGNVDHYNILDFTASNYGLNASGITIGFQAIVYPHSSIIRDSGDWDSEDGSFTQGSSVLYMTGGSSGTTKAQWMADGNGSITFTTPNLEEGAMYGVLVDGQRKYTFTANASNSISFTYSGPWSEHQFKVIETVLTQEVSVLVNLVFLIFAVGIIVGVVAEGTSSLRKMQMRTTEQMMKSLLTMVIYIVIGMASLGVMYSMV